MALYMKNGSLLTVGNLDGSRALRGCCCDGRPNGCLAASCTFWYTFSTVVPSVGGASGSHALGVYHSSGTGFMQESTLWAPENWTIDTNYTFLTSRDGCEESTRARRNGQANIAIEIANSCTLRLAVAETRTFSTPAWSATGTVALSVWSIAQNTVIEIAGQTIVAPGDYTIATFAKTNLNTFSDSWNLIAYAR